jgi:hypothetical protein
MKAIFDPKDILNPDTLTFVRPPQKKKVEEKKEG